MKLNWYHVGKSIVFYESNRWIQSGRTCWGKGKHGSQELIWSKNNHWPTTKFFSKSQLEEKRRKFENITPTLPSSPFSGEVRLPSTMTGAQLSRLGSRGLHAICSDAATSEALQQALHQQRHKNGAAAVAHRLRNAKMTALGNHKVWGLGVG